RVAEAMGTERPVEFLAGPPAKALLQPAILERPSLPADPEGVRGFAPAQLLALPRHVPLDPRRERRRQGVADRIRRLLVALPERDEPLLPGPEDVDAQPELE